MPIIDHTTKSARYMNNVAPQLQQALGGLMQYGLIQQQRQDRQREEMNRLQLADRDFAFRQQQADRGFQFQTQQADRQQGNVDRSFDQRQQLIDREVGQEDAAAEYYRSKLYEMSPGPVGGMDFDGMDAQTLKGVYDAELYSKRLTDSRRSAQQLWEQVLGEFGVDHQTPAAAQVQAMLDGADTIEDVEKAKAMGYQLAQQAREQQFDAQRRAMAVEGTKPMRADVKNPALMASLSVLDQQFMNRDLEFRQYWSEVGKVIEAAQGGGERPTVERIAYGKGLDALAGRIGSGDLTAEEGSATRAELARAFGQELPAGAQAQADRPSGGSAIPPRLLQEARSVVGKKSDPQAQLSAAMDQAVKIARASGRQADDETLAAIMEQILAGAGQSGRRGFEN